MQSSSIIDDYTPFFSRASYVWPSIPLLVFVVVSLKCYKSVNYGLEMTAVCLRCSSRRVFSFFFFSMLFLCTKGGEGAPAILGIPESRMTSL